MKRKRPYAYTVFAVCFFMVLVTLGFGSSTKGTYLTAVTGSLGLKRGLFTVGDSLRYITKALLDVFFGFFVTKIGARRMVGFGFLSLVLSFTVYGFATDYWMFYIGGIFLGAGLAWTTTSVVGVIVEKWFAGAKGTVMGIILAANGLGGVASEFIITRVIYGKDGQLSDAESHWRTAYFITAGLFLLYGLLAVILLRNTPEEKGETPSGEGSIKKKKRGLSWEGYEMSVILRMPEFYVSGLCVFSMGLFLQSITNAAKPYMYDLGFEKNYVLWVFSLHSLLLAAAKILTGVLYDRFGIRLTMGLSSVCALISVVGLCLMNGSSTVIPWVYSTVSSFALPIETVMIPLLVSQMFGSRCYAHVMGYYLALNTAGYAVGVPLVNAVYDSVGSYLPIFRVLAVVMAAATVLSQISLAAADKRRLAFFAS